MTNHNDTEKGSCCDKCQADCAAFADVNKTNDCPCHLPSPAGWGDIGSFVEDFLDAFPYRTRDIAEYAEKGKMADYLAEKISLLLTKRDRDRGI